MNLDERLAICRRVRSDKTLVSLPLNDLKSLDAYLRDTWQIKPLDSFESWDDELRDRCGDDLYDEYCTLHDQRAEFVEERIPDELDREFYNLISRQPLLGFIHSQKRPHILDIAAHLQWIIAAMEVKGPVLDVGCNVGYHSLWLARQFDLDAVGVDTSKASILTARRASKGTNAKFEHRAADAEIDMGKFDLLFAIDSITLDTPQTSTLVSCLRDGGIAMIGGNVFEDDPVAMARNLLSHNLCFGYADVAGGWFGGSFGYQASGLLVLLKGEGDRLPEDFVTHMKDGWPGFRDYANTDGVPWEEKTQAYFRAKPRS